MKLYIVSNSPNWTGDIDGSYCLVSEEGEALYNHWCSNKAFAYGDLIGKRKNRQIECKEKFGDYEVLYLGEDDMTQEKLLELNKKFYEETKKD